MKFEIFVDEATLLIPPSIEHSVAVFDIIDRQRKDLKKWLPWIDRIASEKDVVNYILEATKFNRGGQKLTTFIFHDGGVVGGVDLIRIDKQNSRAELGYWLDRQSAGKGIATRSCSALINFSFKCLDLHKLVLRVIEHNTASRSIAQRLGFTLEGFLREEIRHNGRFHNVERYGMLNFQWEQ